MKLSISRFQLQLILILNKICDSKNKESTLSQVSSFKFIIYLFVNLFIIFNLFISIYFLLDNVVMRLVDVNNPVRDVAAMLRSSRAGAGDARLVGAFVDLLEKGLNIDTTRRLLVADALKHPFFDSGSNVARPK